MNLIKYRETQDQEYKYFWISEAGSIISPLLDKEEEALKWAKDLNEEQNNSCFDLEKSV